MLMFRVLGSWVRGLYLFGFGAFWVLGSYYISSTTGNPATTGFVIGGLMMVSGGIVIARGLSMTTPERSTLPKATTGWRDDGKPLASDTGFDADAAISRYLQNRPQSAEPLTPMSAEPEPAPAAPARPSFGRKQA
jgi:hypothetical protein